MEAFHNDPKIKTKFLKRLRAHRAADEIIHGVGWEKGKGCAVGCTLHQYNHAAYETELGIPEWLARLEDTLFEHLQNGEAKDFPVKFLRAIPVGMTVDKYNRVKWKFSAFILKENIDRVLTLSISDDLKKQVIDAIRGVLTLHEEAIKTGTWSAAWSAAESAAWSAWSAAESAARSARSAWSAWSAAAYKRYATELLKLLKEEGCAKNLKNTAKKKRSATKTH